MDIASHSRPCRLVCTLLVLDVFVGYGRAPLRAFYATAVFVVIGYLVFRRKEGMMPQRPEDASYYYSPFWYSVDLLVPVIDLDATHAWMPRHERPFAHIYMRVHRLAGWLLIPIGVAAVTSVIKKRGAAPSSAGTRFPPAPTAGS